MQSLHSTKWDIHTISRYTYIPLSDSNTIRVLRLLPHKDKSAPIECQLHGYVLPDSGTGRHPYEALSYVWGSGSKPQSIFLDGYYLPVTENLHAALLRLRDHGLARTLWVDAVCINQQDDKEKSHQVPLMRTIYGQASCVIVWLGGDQDQSNEAMECIRLASQKERKYAYQDQFLRKLQRKEPKVAIWDKKSHLSAAVAILQRPWFRRIWVLQEVGLARSILVMCGSATLSGYTFVSGLQKMALYMVDPGLGLWGLVRPMFDLIKKSIFRPQYQANSRGTFSIGELIDMYHTHEATWSHDKIYALLGMCSDDPHIPALRPNYELPWNQVFQQTVEYILPDSICVTTCPDTEAAVIKGKGQILALVWSVRNYGTGSSLTLISHEPEWTDKNDEWMAPASAKPIHQGDLLCLLQGASEPGIIRPCGNYFAVIMIRAQIEFVSTHLKLKTIDDAKENRLHDLQLVWNWATGDPDVQQEQGLAFDVQMPFPMVPVWEDIATLTATTSPETIEAFLQQWGESIPLTEKVIRAAAGNNYSEKGLQLILEHRGDCLPITKEVVKIAAANPYCGATIMMWLVEHMGDSLPLTEEVVNAVARNPNAYPMLEYLLKRRGDTVTVTEEIVKTVARNPNVSDLMRLLLEHRGGTLPITEGVIKTLAGNTNGFLTMTILFRKWGVKLPFTEEIIQAFARSGWGRRVLDLLLREWKELPPTPRGYDATTWIRKYYPSAN
ncbi:HET-domain-containing protein [Aspergillus ellipticus CBS 707.79]|uniref:HET-domain-containing protein n=1 Tax=Aspergillus ellipticus CBS 707.79 TaxID=1448320 RepID=A0A319D0I3_9EURO|nr:HET-domain-containing protein [Aspergillus ellipticus CBS 707.79]